MSIWVLTKDVNDYNQYGEYFIDAWDEKPTVEQVASSLGFNLNKFNDSFREQIERIVVVGSNTRDFQDESYYLVQHK